VTVPVPVTVHTRNGARFLVALNWTRTTRVSGPCLVLVLSSCVAWSGLVWLGLHSASWRLCSSLIRVETTRHTKETLHSPDARGRERQRDRERERDGLRFI
jgi:hypothetical protein